MVEKGITELELHAFIDGELDFARAREVAAEVAAAPDLAKRVAAFRRDKEMLARIYGPLAERPLPAPLRQCVAVGGRRRVVVDRTRAAIALAAAALIAIAIFLGGIVLNGGAPDALLAEALAAREGRLAAESRATAADIPQPAAREALLARALAVPIKVPDLRKAGYELTTLSRYAGKADLHAIELSYRNARGGLFTVYLSQPTGRQGFSLRKSGGTRICIWETEELSAVMIGEMSTDEMLRIASLTYADLNF